MRKNRRSLLWLCLWAGVMAVGARADVVETKSGARLIGKITQIDGTTVTMKTEYAGELKIKQKEVVSLQTDKARHVRLSEGEVQQGTLVPLAAGAGQVGIQTGDKTVATTVDKIAATWPLDGRDPAIAAKDPQWKYEATGDLTGKSGNREQFGTAVSGRITRKGVKDKLMIYSAYSRQESNDRVYTDQFKAGVDYTNNFSGRKSWYARDEAGYDRVKDIERYNVAGSGFGYDFVKNVRQLLTGRAGLSFRYDEYGDPASEDVHSLGLDFGAASEYTFSDAKLINRITYVPAFDDFSNYRFNHESYFEIPLANPAWKLRLGITHEYHSQPGDGLKNLDTTYFTRFVLKWE